MIVTRSWTPKGSFGRRGWAHRLSTFVAVDGKANQLKVYRHQGEISHNGGCQKCGKVFAEFALKWASAPDGWLKACPGCVSAWHLHTENIVSPFYFIGMNPRPTVSKMVQPAFFAYRIFVDLTRGGAVEVATYSDYQAIKNQIEAGIGTLKTWVHECSRDSLAVTMNEMVLVATVLSDAPSPLATMRQELHLVEYLVGQLGECESFQDLMALAAKAKEIV